MATLSNTTMTLLDWAKNQSPDGTISTVIELLSQKNQILDDMLWMEGNLATGHRTTQRTGLPTSYWRKINAGVPASTSTEVQVDEGTGMLEAYNEVDQALANLGGNPNQVRFNKAKSHMEGMSQEMAATLFYGASTAPEEFVGLSPRYNDLSASNGENIIDAGGTGSDNSSIWLIGWGDETVSGIFPKGSNAGLTHRDLGEVTIENANGVTGDRMEAYRDHFKWDAGIALSDWRYCVRIANIDISVLVGDPAAATTDLIDLMVSAIHAVPDIGSA